MDYDKILQVILDIGEEMLVCGAEVNRVENSIYRMCESYGADRINVYIITSNIQLTVEAPDGKIITQIRCVVRYNANYTMLDKFNELSRRICETTPDINTLREEFDTIVNTKHQPKWVKYLGATMVAGGFTVFFEGSPRDGIAAALVGMVIIFMERYLDKREKNELVYYFVVSFVSGLASVATVKLGIGENLDKIMIGAIMLLIPGIAMTNAIRDMLIGDLGSGLLRLSNALLVAFSIACGFAVTIVTLGGFI